MSNPARPPQEPTGNQLRLGSAPDAWLPSGFADVAKSYKKTEVVQKVLDMLDMDMRKTFMVPKDLTKSAAVLARSGPALALAKAGTPVPRVRSSVAKRLQVAVFERLPVAGPFSKANVSLALRNRVFVDGGTEATVGRLAVAYPRRGATPPQPVTRAEAQAALVNCGMDIGDLPASVRTPFPLFAEEGVESVRVNPKAGSGFPVLAAWSEPGVPEMVASLATAIRRELRPGQVEEWLRRAEMERPYLVAVRGKAKADYYSPEKVEKAKLRFYNEFPRQMLMIMQQATQPFERLSRNILYEGHSGIGMTLVRGGARELVARLDEQLERLGYAYVHVGDDSWVIVRPPRGRLCMFALDCSNFDLTQHGAVTLRVHEAVRAQLRTIDQVAADLWFAYARERMVVVTGALVRQFRHGGPSGLPLQSKVNDMLMDVLINRVVAQRATILGANQEEQVAKLLEQTGHGMGFVVRIEQYYEAREARTVLELLSEQPFLFVGYYFHNSRGLAEVMCDLPRTLAQVPYPTVKWTRGKEELEVLEAMRLGSIAMNLGMATPAAAAALGEFREQARALLRDVLQRFGDREDDRLRWAVQESPYVGPSESSLSGLLRALERPAEALWNEVERELISESVLVPVNWADTAEDEERSSLKELGVEQPIVPRARVARPLFLRPGVVTTHPATRANDGRPPPTAVWGPDKPPRRAPEFSTARGRRRDGIARREFEEAMYEFSQSEEDEYEYL